MSGIQASPTVVTVAAKRRSRLLQQTRPASSRSVLTSYGAAREESVVSGNGASLRRSHRSSASQLSQSAIETPGASVSSVGGPSTRAHEQSGSPRDAFTSRDARTTSSLTNLKSGSRKRKSRTFTPGGESVTTYRDLSERREIPRAGRAASTPASSVVTQLPSSLAPASDVPYIVAVDLGTTNTAVAFQCRGPDFSVLSHMPIQYVTKYPDSPQTIQLSPVVPSLLKYDEDSASWKFGFEVPANDVNAIRGFKLLISSSDDNSPARQRAEQKMSESQRSVDELVTTFLARSFHALRSHLDHATARPRVQILAAVPSQTDQLAKKCYEECLQRAAEQQNFQITSVRIFPESLAVTRDCVESIPLPGTYLLHVHDGGGGTTHFHMTLVHVGPDRSIEREDIHVPPYLSRGGDDTDAHFEVYIKQRYPHLSPAQLIAFQRLWSSVLKVKDDKNWALDDEWRTVLPLDFVLDDEFRRAMQTRVFDPVLDVIVKYLIEESATGTAIFQAQRATLMSTPRRQRVSMWDIEDDDAHEPGVDTQPEDDRTTGRRGWYQSYESVFVFAGGHSMNVRLRQKLDEAFRPGQWTSIANPQLGVVKGLILLNDDERSNVMSGLNPNGPSDHRARCGYAIYGWSQTERKSRSSQRNHDLHMYEDQVSVYVVPVGEDISIGREYSVPMRETAAPGCSPTWPVEITLYRHSRQDVQAQDDRPRCPLDAQRVITLTMPTGPVPKKFVVDQDYPEDSSCPAISISMLAYQFKVKVEADALLASVTIPALGDEVVTQTRRPFSELGWTLNEM